MLHVTPRSMEVWSSYVCPVFGTLFDFMGNRLPSYENFSKCLLLHKKKLMTRSGVQWIYGNASYVLVGKDRFFKFIFDYHYYYLYSIRKKKQIVKFFTRIPGLNLKKLNNMRFFSVSNCNSFENCSCLEFKKVPIPEQNFLIDQRNARKMVKCSLDIENTKTLQHRELRKSNLKKFV